MISNPKTKWYQASRYFIAIIASVLVTTVVYAAGTDTSGIGGVAQNIISNFESLAKLITAGSYIAGFGFAVGAILKFKAHKDNPQQIPIGTPIALLFIAAALIFLPSIFATAGHTLFGNEGIVGGVSGVKSFSK